MRILITGSRAPVALDFSRRFHRKGHTVIHADSLKNCLGMFSNSATKAFQVPRPIDSPRAYVESLAAIVEEQQIDWLIPTCEEVFFIAAHRSLLNCRVLTDEFDKLARIHNKWTFSQFAGNEFAAVPETILLDGFPDDGQRITDELPAVEDTRNWVFKPAYSRFGSRTLIGPSARELQQLERTSDDPWIAQRRIRGTEYSTYSIAHNGRLLAHLTYESLYRMGHGSGICFQLVRRQNIEEFIRAFVKSEHYTGQIGFDFISDQDGQLWVLEGNPRATYGAQLFDQTDPLVDALTLQSGDVFRSSSTRLAMVEFAMPFWGLSDAVRQGQWLQFPSNLIRSRWTTMSLSDPGPTFGLLRAFWEIAWIARKERLTLRQATTFDIEWNGGAM